MACSTCGGGEALLFICVATFSRSMRSMSALATAEVPAADTGAGVSAAGAAVPASQLHKCSCTCWVDTAPLMQAPHLKGQQKLQAQDFTG